MAGERAREALARLGVPSVLVNRPDVVREFAPLLSPAARAALEPFPPLVPAISDTAGYFLARAVVGRLLGRNARADLDSAAAVYARKTRERPDDWDYHVGLARTLAALGRGDEAVRAGQRAVELSANDPYEGSYGSAALAEILWQFGERDRAVAQLERHVTATPLYRDLVRHDPRYAAMRTYPRIRRLMGS